MRDLWRSGEVLNALVLTANTVAATAWLFWALFDYNPSLGNVAAPSLLPLVLIGFVCWFVVRRLTLRQCTLTTLWLVGLSTATVTSFLWVSLVPQYRLAALLSYDIKAALTTSSFIFLAWCYGIAVGITGIWLGIDAFQFTGSALRKRALIRLGIAVLGLVVALRCRDAVLTVAQRGLALCIVLSLVYLIIGSLADTRDRARYLKVPTPAWSRAHTPILTALSMTLLLGLLAFTAVGKKGVAYYGLALLRIIQGFVFVLFGFFGAIFGHVDFTKVGEKLKPQAPSTPTPSLPNDTEHPPTDTPGLVVSSGITIMWGVLSAVAVLIVIYLILRRIRRRSYIDSDAGLSSRSRIYSAGLLRQQLAQLFHRNSGAPSPFRRIALEEPPTSIRDTMLRLQVLAARQGRPRLAEESADDFVTCLAEIWPNLSEQLYAVADLYADERYGETQQQLDDARRLWQEIYSSVMSTS